MAGIHNDDSVHRVVSGEPPRVGLRVMNNDLEWGTIVEVATDAGCGYYCNAWHAVRVDNRDGSVGTGTSIFNCDRLTTVDLIRQPPTPDPHPERGFHDEEGQP